VTKAKKRHDHRNTVWIIAGGAWLWCYHCGAIRPNKAGRMLWQKPAGTEVNPALGKHAADTWGLP
jgi:hypothetical protein